MFKIVGNHQKPEKRRFIHSLILPVCMILLMFSIHLVTWLENMDLHFLGVYPLNIKGLTGIITSPLIHSGWQHLYNNSVSFFILGVTLFYFYRGVAYKVFVTIYILAGAWLWFGGREAWHIGASGVVYGLMSFLFISGVIRRHIPLMSVTLFVVFLYGSLVWGMFPLAEQMPHSWEGHLWGFMAGITAAVVYRKEGPQKPPPPFEDEEDEDEMEESEQFHIDQNPPLRF